MFHNKLKNKQKNIFQKTETYQEYYVQVYKDRKQEAIYRSINNHGSEDILHGFHNHLRISSLKHKKCIKSTKSINFPEKAVFGPANDQN